MKLVFLLALIFALPTYAQEKVIKVTQVTLALNWKAEPEFGGLYAAALQGEFKKRNLDVQILEGGSGSPTVQMLANDKVDFAVVSGDEIILSQDRHPQEKVRAVFATYQKAPYIVMTHAEKNFHSLRDVFMSKDLLSIETGLPFYLFLTKKWGKPQAQLVPYSGGVAHFINDKNFSQQGFLTSEPLSAEKAGQKVKSFLVADEGFNPYTVVVATNDSTLKNRPDLVPQMVEAIRAGWDSYLKDPTATNKAMFALNKSMDLETFAKSAQAQKVLILPAQGQKLGNMTSERWQSLISQLKDLNLIKSQIPAAEVYRNF